MNRRKKLRSRAAVNPVDAVAKTRSEPRSEDEIFAELAALCRSPGFVHAIARMCLTDYMIGYVEEAKPEDMLKLYEPSRLLRNEMNALVGLSVKGPMDWADPGREFIDEYIRKSRALSEEIHEAMNTPIAASMRDFFSVADNGAGPAVDPLGSGASMREAIYYGGESAFAFQYCVFHANWTPVPPQTGQPFQRKLDTRSMPNWTPVPRQTRRFGRNGAGVRCGFTPDGANLSN